jgi:hypothetical protein
MIRHRIAAATILTWSFTTLACSLGERQIGALTATGDGSGGGVSGTSASSSTGAGTDAPLVECTEDFVIQPEVSFVRDPGPDGVGTLYVRATADECMLGSALAVWASPGIVDVRDLQENGTGSVQLSSQRIPCVDGVPGVIRLSAFLSEGSFADPTDPLPRLGDMINTVTGEDGIAYSDDRAAGYSCIDVDIPIASVTYEIDEFWFNDPPPGVEGGAGTGL